MRAIRELEALTTRTFVWPLCDTDLQEYVRFQTCLEFLEKNSGANLFASEDVAAYSTVWVNGAMKVLGPSATAEDANKLLSEQISLPKKTSRN